MDGARVALVIANEEYADPGLSRLMAPARDAAALAGVLGDPAVGGFDVQVLENASAHEIRYAVEDFFADRSPEDLLLLHFSCHGLKNAAGELFLAVADTQPTRLASTAVAADFVNRQMADSRAQRIALFLDCCYGGAFPRGLVVRATGEAQVRDAFAGQDRVGGGRGRVVVTASSAMEYAFEGGQLASGTSKPSVFTSAVVDGLTSGDADRDGDGWVGLTELVSYVSDQIHRVTPNQNPQMWTFGSQGELLIARTRSRRIVPTELAPELVQAMESPLPAARFGVVDYLRERLLGDDVGLAYAAWLALTRMTEDDSRKVAEAARQALTEASPSAPWVELTEQGAVLEFPTTPPELLPQPAPALSKPQPKPQPQPDPEPEPVAATREPATAPASAPVSAAVPPTAKPQPDLTQQPVAAKPKPAAPASAPGSPSAPWWLIGALILAALALIAINWPGPTDSRKLWYDESNTGWHVYRSWIDPTTLASIATLVATLAATSAIRALIALGVVLGCAASIVQDGIMLLGAGITYTETTRWVASTLLAATMVALVLAVLRPLHLPLWPVPPLPALLVVAAGILLAISAGIKHEDGISWLTVTKLGLIEPVFAAAIAWLALAATEARARSWLAAAVVSYAVIDMISIIPAYTLGGSPSVVLTCVLGSALLIAAVALSAFTAKVSRE
ncbi:caspase family protein [Kribbella sp. NPDC056861]|uniref:caspase family protein n=1 Tax=Kribbella sp. NPDC056861 TaxID=3154857 RepID=UPI00342442E2